MDPTKNEPPKVDDSSDIDSLEGSSTVIESNQTIPTPTTVEAQKKEEPKAADSGSGTNENKGRFKLSGISGLATRLNIYLLLFIFVLAIAGVVTFVALSRQKNSNTPATVNAQTLSSQSLGQIAGTTTATVGNSKEVLNIQSPATFADAVSINGDLSVSGSLQIGNALTLPGITVSGTSTFNTLQATNLNITGNTTIGGLLTVQKGIDVNGPVTFGGAISASSLAVNSLSLTGDLTIEHHITTIGSLPSVSSCGGGASTASVNGTDTAGTINMNSSCATLTFAQKFGSIPHIVTTPLGNVPIYLSSQTASGFTVKTDDGSAESFAVNYIVVD